MTNEPKFVKDNIDVKLQIEQDARDAADEFLGTDGVEIIRIPFTVREKMRRAFIRGYITGMETQIR